MAEKRVALITGGGSGLGLGVAHLLASKGWRILIVDLDRKRGEAAASELNCLFTRADISNYGQQVQAFENAWKAYGRIDFVFANAGITDTMDFYAKSSQIPPPELNMITVRVNLIGTVYTSYLAMHYFRRNAPGTPATLICTSSGAGLYAADPIPVYSSAKHGVVGLVRSLSRRLATEQIMVHAVLPGAVPTNIVDPDSMKDFPKDHYTSVQDIVDCVRALLFGEGQFENVKTGRIVEVSKGNMYHRDQLPYCDDIMAKVMGQLSETEEIKSTGPKSSKL